MPHLRGGFFRRSSFSEQPPREPSHKSDYFSVFCNLNSHCDRKVLLLPFELLERLLETLS